MFEVTVDFKLSFWVVMVDELSTLGVVVGAVARRVVEWVLVVIFSDKGSSSSVEYE